MASPNQLAAAYDHSTQLAASCMDFIATKSASVSAVKSTSMSTTRSPRSVGLLLIGMPSFGMRIARVDGELQHDIDTK